MKNLKLFTHPLQSKPRKDTIYPYNKNTLEIREKGSESLYETKKEIIVEKETIPLRKQVKKENV